MFFFFLENIFFLNSLFQAVDINCLAYLKIDGFLQPLLTKFSNQPRSLIDLPSKNEQLQYNKNDT